MYLCSGSISPVRVLAAIVSSASIVGLAALPLSWAVWALVTLNPQVTDFSAPLAALRSGRSPAVACLLVGHVHGAVFFVATPNAIAYEGFCSCRCLFFRGSFSRPLEAPAWLDAAGVLIPLQAPVHLLLGRYRHHYPADALPTVAQTSP